jgi:neutral ceramidase
MQDSQVSRRTFHKIAATGAAAASALSSRIANAHEQQAPGLLAGAAEVIADLPAEGTFLIGPMQKSEGVHDPLYIRALVLSDGETKLAIVTNDLLGFDFEYNDQIVDAIHQRTGIPKPQIMINCSHNHSAPLTIPWSESWEKKKDKPWHKTLPVQFADVVEKAAKQMVPATVRCRREPTQISFNRRIEAAHGMTMGPNPDGDQIPWTDAVYLKTVGTDYPIGVLYSYAAHPVIVHGASRQISADYPGFANGHIRGAMNYRPQEGKSLKNGIPMFAQGCCGDINGFPLRSGIEAARGAGRDLGHAVIRALQKKPDFVQGRLRVANRELSLPLQPSPSVAECEKMIAERPHHLPCRTLLEIAKSGTPQFLRLPMQGFALGDDLCILGMAHEPFAAYQLHADKISPFRHTLVLGYTGGCESYLATADAYRMGPRGGYEASPQGAAFFYKHRLPCKPEVEVQIREGIAGIFRDLKTV